MMYIYKARDDAEKIEWEKVRTLSFFSVTAQQGTKHYKKPHDLFKFRWEEDRQEGSKIVLQKDAEKKVQEIRKNTRKK